MPVSHSGGFCRLAKTACKFPTCVILFMRLPQLFHRVSLRFADTLYMPWAAAAAALVSCIFQIHECITVSVCVMCRLAHCFVFGCSCKLLPTRVLFRVRCGLNSSSPGLFMLLLLLLLLLFLLFDKLLLTPFRRCCCCCCVARCMCAHYARLQLLQLQQQQQ